MTHYQSDDNYLLSSVDNFSRISVIANNSDEEKCFRSRWNKLVAIEKKADSIGTTAKQFISSLYKMSKIKKEEEKGKPIELEWCCGVNTQIPVVNLTTRGDNHTIAFAANHLVVLQVRNTAMNFLNLTQLYVT